MSRHARRSLPARGAARPELPELELECMKILWEAGDLTVRGVREQLYKRRPLAYTTVMTVLDRLARKGVVSRRKVGRAHLYHAVYSQEEARRRALDRLLEHYFGGSRDSLLSHLAVATVPRPAAFSAASSAPLQEALDEALL